MRHLDLKNADVLVQGTGTGWDAALWASMRPRRVVAVDLFPFEENRAEIQALCREEWNVPVEFVSTPLDSLAFLKDRSIDLCVSDAVFEHCRDLPAVMRESRRVLRRGGALYASYGPLWFPPGGDYFSGRGGLTNAFAHVGFEPQAYKECFDRNLRDAEGFQSGGRYVKLGLFSKLVTKNYLRVFRDEGFECESLILEMSPKAFEFERLAAMVRSLPEECGADDLRIKSNLVRLLRK